MSAPHSRLRARIWNELDKPDTTVDAILRACFEAVEELPKYMHGVRGTRDHYGVDIDDLRALFTGGG